MGPALSPVPDTADLEEEEEAAAETPSTSSTSRSSTEKYLSRQGVESWYQQDFHETL